MTNVQKNIIIKFLIWSITLFSVIFVGVNKIFALTWVNIGYSTDVTVVLLSPDYTNAPVDVPKNTSYNFYDVTALDIIVSNTTFEANKTYQLEFDITQQKLENANKYQVFGLNGESCLVTYDTEYTRFDGQYPRWAFECPHQTNTITIEITNSSGGYLWAHQQTNIFTWVYTYLKYTTSSISGNSANDIINNQNQNTQNIINNQNQNSQDIINNQNQNTQNIINNQNNLYTSCSNQTITQTYADSSITSSLLYDDGSIATDSNFRITDYVEIKPNNSYNVKVSSVSMVTSSFCLYDKDKVLVSCTQYNRRSSITFTTGSNVYYFRSSLHKNSSPLTLTGIICTNTLDEQNKTSKGILGKLKDLFDTLFSDDDADVSGLNNMVGWLPPGPVDSIINLPLSFFNALTNTLTGTCVSVSLTLPYVNKTLVLPCFDSYMSQYLTNFSTFWTLVGFIGSVFILYHYLLALYKWIDDTLTLRENNLPGYYDDNWGGGA